MITPIFGKDFIRLFFPELDGEGLNLYSQSPTIYIFDAQPTRTDAAAGTGADSTISSWTEQDTAPFARFYTVPAIDDPEPTSTTNSRTYWEAINFRYAAAEQIQTLVRAFEIERVTALDDLLIASKNELKGYFPGLSNYVDDNDLDEYLVLATDKVKNDIQKKGLDWYKLREHSRLKLALIYKTIALSQLGQIREVNDRFKFRFDQFEKWYTEEMAALVLPYDSDGDGLAEEKRTPGDSTQFLYR